MLTKNEHKKRKILKENGGIVSEEDLRNFWATNTKYPHYKTLEHEIFILSVLMAEFRKTESLTWAELDRAYETAGRRLAIKNSTEK